MHCWWECKLAQPLWKTVWRFLKKLKIELPYHPAIALLGIYPRDTGVLFLRDTCTPTFIAALSTVAKVWKEPKCPSMDEWIKRLSLALLVGMQTGAATLENSMEVPQKIKNRTTL